MVKSLKGKLMTIEAKVAKHLKHTLNSFSPSNNLIFEIMKVYKQILQTRSWSQLKLLHAELAPQSQHPATFSDHRSCNM